jgi:orotate phosphoribosyltransferase
VRRERCGGGRTRSTPVERMLAPMLNRVTPLLEARRGHFKMESGYHSPAWFELGSLFDDPVTVRPFVAELARRLSPHRPDAVCGPMTGGAKLAELLATELGIDAVIAERSERSGATGMFPVRYRIPETQRQKTRGRRIAIVDDAISAGSAVRGTHADLIECRALPVALGALVVFGDAAVQFAADNGLALEAIERMPFDMWRPAECPLCKDGVALDTGAARSG